MTTHKISSRSFLSTQYVMLLFFHFDSTTALMCLNNIRNNDYNLFDYKILLSNCVTVILVVCLMCFILLISIHSQGYTKMTKLMTDIRNCKS